MHRVSIASLLAPLAVALPFGVAVTESPLPGFWPLWASWICGAVLLFVAGLVVGHTGNARGKLSLTDCTAGAGAVEGCAGQAALWLAWGLIGAAVLSAGVGLAQYFWGDLGWAPWVHPSEVGQAPGNLRQRNQQATLLSMGAWALLWCLRYSLWPALRPGSGRPGGLLPLVLVLVALLACAAAATASRTGALQWLVLGGLLLCWQRTRWPRTGGGSPEQATHQVHRAWWAWGWGVLVYGGAVWGLPALLARWKGVDAIRLLERWSGDGTACNSRTVLWDNMLTLIAHKPWWGWGWGEVAYAHYVTPFPGGRFCVLLDNAHNLPLQIAVEWGVPVALLVGTTALWLCLRARPWREPQPQRQLAWGLLALVGLHSLLEYPLWYGPFQITCLYALAVLCWPRQTSRRWALGLFAGAGAVVLVCAVLALDYGRVAQLYKPVQERAPAFREHTQAKVQHSLAFQTTVDFARLTTTPLTPENAQPLHALALSLLHYSPEPRVIEAVIESALLLGRDQEAASHAVRYRAAYPGDYARWRKAGGALSALPGS